MKKIEQKHLDTIERCVFSDKIMLEGLIPAMKEGISILKAKKPHLVEDAQNKLALAEQDLANNLETLEVIRGIHFSRFGHKSQMQIENELMEQRVNEIVYENEVEKILCSPEPIMGTGFFGPPIVVKAA